MDDRLEKIFLAMDAGNPPNENSNIFGATITDEDARLILIPVPWEVTVSYGGGTSMAPDKIMAASHFLDLTDVTFGLPYRAGIYMLPSDSKIKRLSDETRGIASQVITQIERGVQSTDSCIDLVNEASGKMNEYVYDTAKTFIEKNRFVAVVGGDHSVPYGLIKAIAQHNVEGFGVLHFDAHHDLREKYEGFIFSHASIMYNVLNDIPQVKKLVSLGIRDYSLFEFKYAQMFGDRVYTCYSEEIFKRKASGESFAAIVREILSMLPQKVYLSFDIDVLEPEYCPGTGTPVPGGFSYQEAIYILNEVALSGRKIIGFDLCEVSSAGSGQYDANVGARILYKLCGSLITSQLGTIS
ncbi:MAG: agmatinase family protein [Oligoflexales bacterium]|nr:agmatinase family protein [Oligoflexales bacterium]